MKPLAHTALALLTPLALGLVAGCGGAGPSTAAASAVEARAEEPEPTTVEEAEERIRQARAQLQPAVKAMASESKPTADQAAPVAPPSGAERQECRALHSLERATKALCRLTSADDPRCKEATEALEQDRTKLTCP